jgi:N-methylhydantoinase A/oxoprolinase/acetone carboxylase beta subunit
MADKISRNTTRKGYDIRDFSLLRLIARVKGRKISPLKITWGTPDSSTALKRTRKCFFEGKYLEMPVYDSEKLRADNIIPGPAIIEAPTTYSY